MDLPTSNVPNQTALNWNMWSQTKISMPNHHVRSAGILHSRGWYSLTNVLGQPISPTFKGQEIQKKEQSMTEVH
jgi:hypothetical protein